ncbi:MAG: hypothetical protein WCX06_00530 [Candidatus Paceibacterota bacterium]|jgi:hypothetical protein
MCKGHYSPKIRADYIPFLYFLAHYLGLPMTQVVNQIIGGVVESLMNKELLTEWEAMKAEDREFAEISEYLNRLIRSKNRLTKNKIVRMFEEASRQTRNGGAYDCVEREG